jgi:hypothetical protein
MTKDEALKLALEALEYEADKGNDNAYQRERDAIKQALAAQRKPLTNEQITEIYTKWEATKGTSWFNFARAIEAAHGIKENT